MRVFIKQFKMHLLMLLSAIFICSPVWAKQQKVKVYIPKEAIELTANGISLIADGDTIPLSSLYSDENGFFIYDTQLKAKMPYHECEEHGKYQSWMDTRAGDGCPRCHGDSKRGGKNNNDRDFSSRSDYSYGDSYHDDRERERW